MTVDTRRSPSEQTHASANEPVRKKAKKSRWGTKTIIPGLTTKVPELNPHQEKVFLLQLKVEQARSLLRRTDLGIPQDPDERSLSPEPIYDATGQRTNTREARTRKKLEDTLQQSIQDLQMICPQYVPPADCRQNTKYTSKVFIPAEKYPQVNFVGMLIGPRGTTLKELEEESGCKIIIRGKGSVKEGKLGGADMMLPGAEEPLHAYLNANHHDSIQKATALINKIVEDAIDDPDGESGLRQKQMMQLAVLNGTTTKATDLLSKVKEKAESKKVFTNCLVCTICGSGGHLSTDCKFKDDASGLQNAKLDQMQMNTEYISLMKELNKNDKDANEDNQLPSVQGQLTDDKEIAVCNWQDLFAMPSINSFVNFNAPNNAQQSLVSSFATQPTMDQQMMPNSMPSFFPPNGPSAHQNN